MKPWRPCGIDYESSPKERDRDQYHTPKNLSMALIAEVAEPIEHFQWVDGNTSHLLAVKSILTSISLLRVNTGTAHIKTDFHLTAFTKYEQSYNLAK